MYRNIQYINSSSSIRYWTWDDDGNRLSKEEPFSPYVYVETKSDKHDGISIFNTNLKKVEFKSEKSRREYVDRYNGRLFGNVPVKQQFILDKFLTIPLQEMLKNPIKVFFLDIEAVSDSGFPEPDLAEFCINVITIYDSISGKFHSWGMNSYNYDGLSECGIDPSDVIYNHCKTEKELLGSFIKFWSGDYPDIVSGWNSSSFDMPYLINRCKKILGDTITKKLSPAGWLYSRTRKNFFGKYYTHWTIEGVSDVDYLELYVKSIPNDRESYKLDYIGEYEGIGSKVEYEEGNLYDLMKTDWNKFVTYNIQDVNIILSIDEKRRYITIARAKAYRGYSPLEKCLDSVPIVTGMLSKAALDDGKILLTTKPNGDGPQHLDGGFVFEPSGKVHDGVVSFDVNSLYPNTMITLNTSPETKVGKVTVVGDDREIVLRNGKSKRVTDAQLKQFLSSNNIAISKSNILFSQKRMGLCPGFLDALYKERKEIQANMAKETDELCLAQMDIEQYLIKILLNSVYGVFANPYFCLYDIDIASSVTMTGSAMIRESAKIAQEYVKDNYSVTDDIVVYGDSVTGDTPLLLKNSLTGDVTFKQIDEISEEWEDYSQFKLEELGRTDKEQSKVSIYKIWTSDGWSDIKRVIRHKVKKDIYRVKTHIGLVDVTEDHSLLDSDKNPLKPIDCKVGQELLHHYPNFNNKSPKSHSEIYKIKDLISDLSIENQKAFIYGFFYGDGSCGFYNCKSGDKYSWAINNSNTEYNNLLVDLLGSVYGEEFKILDTIKSSGVYKIVPSTGNKKYVLEYRHQFYNYKKYKIVPDEILNAQDDIKESFLAGYFLADGYKCDNTKCKNLTFHNKGKIGIFGINYLFKSLGYNCSLNDRSDKKNVYRLLATPKKLRKSQTQVKGIYKLYSSDGVYVYDIETNSGNFNTGTPLIVKNTDSNFFDFGKVTKSAGIEFFKDGKVTNESLDLIEDFTKNLNVKINEWSRSELFSINSRYNFSREKICIKGFFLRKKNYILRILNNDGVDCDDLVAVGVELKKSTHSQPVKDIMWDVVNCIFYDKGKDAADKFYVDGLDVFSSLPPVDIAKRSNIKDYSKYASRCNGTKVALGTPQHCKGAIYYNYLIDLLKLGNKYSKIESGQKVKMIYLHPNIYGFDCIAFVDVLPPEFGLEPDYRVQYKKMVASLLNRCYVGNNWKLPNIDKRLKTDLFRLMEEL